MIRVLIADDHPVVRAGYQRLLEQAGDIRVVADANDGQEALDKVRSESPDLVLLDVMMPRKNGYEVCQEIRAEPALQATRILMLTAKGRETEVTKGMAMGADAYMTKPFSTKELVAKVKLLLDIPA